MLNVVFRGLLLTVLISISSSLMATGGHSAGALLFKVNCSQCHGALGLGDGYYPGLSKLGNTNLLDITKDTSAENLSKAIGNNSKHQSMSEFKPLDSALSKKLILFLEYYYANPNDAFKLLNNTVVYKLPSMAVGESTYRRRCVICHGVKGDGKGRLAKIVKSPSPYDLRGSIISDGLLRQIIEVGGTIQGRFGSDKMPGFKDEISAFELESLMLYVKQFRSDILY